MEVVLIQKRKLTSFVLVGKQVSLALLRQQRLNKSFFGFVSVFVFESSLKALKIPYHNYKSGMQLLQHNNCMEGYGVMHASEGSRTNTYCSLYSVPALYLCPKCHKAASEAVTGNLGVVSKFSQCQHCCSWSCATLFS